MLASQQEIALSLSSCLHVGGAYATDLSGIIRARPDQRAVIGTKTRATYDALYGKDVFES